MKETKKLSFVLIEVIAQELTRENGVQLFKGLLSKDIERDCKLLSDKERSFIAHYIQVANLFHKEE